MQDAARPSRRTAPGTAGRGRGFGGCARRRPGVAWSPAITAAGSPGAMYSRLKTNSATIPITGIVASMRRKMYETMRSTATAHADLRHAPEERQRPLDDAGDVLAPRLVAEEEAGRRIDHVIERRLVEPRHRRLLLVEVLGVEPGQHFLLHVGHCSASRTRPCRRWRGWRCRRPGLMQSAPACQVWNMPQPPWPGGVLHARGAGRRCPSRSRRSRRSCRSASAARR